MTSYPKRPVQYPLVTIKAINLNTKKLGMSSELVQVNMDIEVRAWCRNMKEKDDVTQDIINTLRDLQLGTNSSSINKLYKFELASCVNVLEEDIKSSVLTFKYYTILGET